jgi:hypothetical protein
MARIATTDLYSARGTEMPSSPVSPVSPIFHRFYTDNALRKGADDEMLVDVDPRPATMPPLRRSPIADMEFCQRLPKVEVSHPVAHVQVFSCASSPSRVIGDYATHSRSSR